MVDYFNAFFRELCALIPKAVEMKIVYVFFQTLSLPLCVLVRESNLQLPAVKKQDPYHLNFSLV